MVKKIALITGASAGIGKELARTHAAHGGDLVLVARRKPALEALKAELDATHGITAHVVAADLGTVDGASGLLDTIEDMGIEIDILVNNAGIGGHGFFHEQDLERSLAIVDLNVKSLMVLTYGISRLMAERGHGRILNVGSTAGTIPGPLQATYHASKAFVNSFSQALSNELVDRGVTVTVLAPGAVATEFFEKADMEAASGVQKGVASAADVARIGYHAMQRGDIFVFNDFKLRLVLDWLVPFLPRRMALKIARSFSDKVD